MSDFSQSDCDNHEQSIPLAQRLPSTSSNLENDTQPHSPRPPAHQVLSEDGATEKYFAPSSTSEETVSCGDEDGGNDKSTGSGDGIKVSNLIASPGIHRKDIKAAQTAKVANFLPSAPTTAIVIPPRTPLLGRFIRLFQSIKAKANKPFMQPGPRYRDSCDIPAPEHMVPPINSVRLRPHPEPPTRMRTHISNTKYFKPSAHAANMQLQYLEGYGSANLTLGSI
ncbi:hypothetical protein FIBSPDRAFT_929714 [Athelia psychrophila]|uniref:Uncharacterized protein n=1 Tax=Athelia psychrophila TaxID=1759441 RepID=A0A166NC28_9AGAM|nr:hypothetical protein FIBSPDRAFT_929714 [Fibularhizoctonia sp. CBS 109695]